MHEQSFLLPRSAFSPREAARAGDVWRLFQDVAVAGSIAAGWPPARYREERVSFVVRSMVVVHERESLYGEHVIGTTWPSRFRRGLFFRRECRASSERGPIAAATQEWVHVSSDLEIVRASDALTASFPIEDNGPSIELPSFEKIEGGRTHRFELTCWQTWMDPLGHVNHPAYVDFADEATSRAMLEAGLDPIALAPVAEEATFKSGIVAGDQVLVETRVIGRRGDDAVLEHRISASSKPCARVVAIRRAIGASLLTLA